VLFNRISCTIRILCFYDDTIANTNNDITYNRGSNEFLIATLDISLNKLFWMLLDRLGWKIFEIKVKITWRMMQNGFSVTRYVDVPICSDESVNSMFGFCQH